MQENSPLRFSSPEEEIAYLKEQIARRERELLDRTPEIDNTDIETVGKQELFEYGTFTPDAVLRPEFQMNETELASEAAALETAKDQVSEVVALAESKGIHNALSVLDRLNNPYATDEVHRRLIELIRAGRVVAGLKEGVPPWQVLHMTLFEVTLPELPDEDREMSLTELVGTMGQFLAGMQAVSGEKRAWHYTLELAVSDKSDDIVFYVAVPTASVDLFEKQLLSLFPHALLVLQQNDYNIFTDDAAVAASTFTLNRHPIYPLRTNDEFESD
ncbi:hypothetical protein KDA23_07705, partial [Candidatus Saccharibacteria bacterium]|nr:hypothetical protein [Candidatus Saccharibacteria bacterium]